MDTCSISNEEPPDLDFSIADFDCRLTNFNAKASKNLEATKKAQANIRERRAGKQETAKTRKMKISELLSLRPESSEAPSSRVEETKARHKLQEGVRNKGYFDLPQQSKEEQDENEIDELAIIKSLDELDTKMKHCIKGLATLVAKKAEEKANENKVEELKDLTEPCCQLKSELIDTIPLDESLESKMDSLESRVDSLESWLESIQDVVAAWKIKADDASSEELLSQVCSDDSWGHRSEHMERADLGEWY